MSFYQKNIFFKNVENLNIKKKNVKVVWLVCWAHNPEVVGSKHFSK
jgi:hypothetical protein